MSEYMCGRVWRPISIRSRKPCVVIIAMRPPRRWMRALVPTVVPWESRRKLPGSMPRRTANACNPSMIARAGLSGVDGLLPVWTAPVVSSSA